MLFTGQLLLAKDNVEHAFAAFKIILDGDRDSAPTVLVYFCGFNFMLRLCIIMFIDFLGCANVEFSLEITK